VVLTAYFHLLSLLTFQAQGLFPISVPSLKKGFSQPNLLSQTPRDSQAAHGHPVSLMNWTFIVLISKEIFFLKPKTNRRGGVSLF
jgi:hypothetical protein